MRLPCVYLLLSFVPWANANRLCSDSLGGPCLVKLIPSTEKQSTLEQLDLFAFRDEINQFHLLSNGECIHDNSRIPVLGV
jgi:hypothetical protein